MPTDAPPTDYFSPKSHPSHHPPLSPSSTPSHSTYPFCFPRTFSPNTPPSHPPSPLSPRSHPANFAYPPYPHALQPSLALHRFLQPASARGFQLPRQPPRARGGTPAGCGIDGPKRPSLSSFQALSHAYPGSPPPGPGTDEPSCTSSGSKPSTPMSESSDSSVGEATGSPCSSAGGEQPQQQQQKKKKKKTHRNYTPYIPSLPSPTFRTYFPTSSQSGTPPTSDSASSSRSSHSLAGLGLGGLSHSHDSPASSPTPLAELDIFFRGSVGSGSVFGPPRAGEEVGSGDGRGRRPRMRRGASGESVRVWEERGEGGRAGREEGEEEDRTPEGERSASGGVAVCWKAGKAGKAEIDNG